MSTKLESWVLPAGASRIDRATLVVWRFWDGWLRGALDLARSLALGVVILAAIAWFMFDGSFYGVVGVLVAASVVVSVVVGIGLAGRRHREQQAMSAGRVVVAVLVGLPLGLGMMSFGVLGMMVVTSFVVVPALNHPILLVVVVPAAFGLGYGMQRWRKRNDAMYPQRVDSGRLPTT